MERSRAEVLPGCPEDAEGLSQPRWHPLTLWKNPGVQHLEFKLRGHSHKHRGDFSPIISTRLLSCANTSLGASLCLTRSQCKCWGTSSYKAGPKCMEQLWHRASRMIWKDRLTVTLFFFFFQFYVMTSQKNAVKLSHILPLCAALWIPECHRCPEMGNTLVQLGG